MTTPRDSHAYNYRELVTLLTLSESLAEEGLEPLTIGSMRKDHTIDLSVVQLTSCMQPELKQAKLSFLCTVMSNSFRSATKRKAFEEDKVSYSCRKINCKLFLKEAEMKLHTKDSSLIFATLCCTFGGFYW